MISASLKKSLLCRNNFISLGRFAFARKLEEPSNPGSITEMKVDVGDYCELERTFNGEDLKLFSEAIQDKFAAHKQSQSGGESTFYRSDIVYGIFTSATFTALFRSYFPKAIYLS